MSLPCNRRKLTTRVQIPVGALIVMKYKRFKQIKEDRKKIALERIEILNGMIEKKPEFAERYKELIKKISNKYRLKIDF